LVRTSQPQLGELLMVNITTRTRD